MFTSPAALNVRVADRPTPITQVSGTATVILPSPLGGFPAAPVFIVVIVMSVPPPASNAALRSATPMIAVSWPELAGYDLSGYGVYVDGSATPTLVTSNYYVISGLGEQKH